MIALNSRFILLVFALLALTALIDQSHAKKHCQRGKHCKTKSHSHKGHDSGHHGGGSGGSGGLSVDIGNLGEKQRNAQSSSNSNSGSGISVDVNIDIGRVVPPRGKAGLAGGQSLKWIGSSLSWFIDWTAHPDSNEYARKNNLTLVPMLWGAGRVDHDDDWQRMQAFKKLRPGDYKYVAGFNEADFKGFGSSGVIEPHEAAALWDQYLGPHKEAGSLLISPSCAKQKDEDWMGPFLSAAKHKPDIIAVHIFQDKPEKVKSVLDHYAKYGLPMFITEVACINYQISPAHFCSQQEVNDFIWGVIQIFENDSRVAGYAISDANNGPNSALTANQQGQSLTETGHTVLTALKQLALSRRSLDEEGSAQEARIVKRSPKWGPRSEQQPSFDVRS